MFPFLQDREPMLDSATGTGTGAEADEVSFNGSALNSEIQSLRTFALSLVLILSQAIIDNDLEENELPTDRLDKMLAGISDDGEEEIDIDQATMDILIANVMDAFESLGVSEDILAVIFSEDAEANEALENAAEIVESNKPQSDEDLEDFFDLFVYGEAEDDDSEMMLDGVSVGKTTTKTGKYGKLVYKAVKAIRNGKVTVINKRMSGKVKLSSKQRQALSKARKKASASSAIKKRIRSMKKAKNLNI